LPAFEQAHDDIQRAWHVLATTGCRRTREQLILHYVPLVKFVAARVGAGLPASVEHDDLVSYGTIGLIEAVDRFDLRRKVKFETYAVPRIRGAILDELRALDWVPRSIRARQRQIDRASSELRAEFHREPTQREIADEIGCDTRDVRRARPMAVVALEELVALGGGEDGEYATVLDTILDTSVEDPGADMERNEIRRVLAGAMLDLTERDSEMLALYYFAERTLNGIGDQFGVTESRVSQIHTRALRELRRSEVVRTFGDFYGWTEPSEATEARRIA